MPDSDLALIGRICCIWGHIDIEVDSILMSVGGLTPNAFKHLFAMKTMPPKLEALKVFCETLPEPQKTPIINMCDSVLGCVQDRNLVIHGQWAYMENKASKEWVACAYNLTKKRQFLLKDLPIFHEKIHSASLATNLAFCSVFDIDPLPEVKNRRLMFADSAPDENTPLPPEQFLR